MQHPRHLPASVKVCTHTQRCRQEQVKEKKARAKKKGEGGEKVVKEKRVVRTHARKYVENESQLARTLDESMPKQRAHNTQISTQHAEPLRMLRMSAVC